MPTPHINISNTSTMLNSTTDIEHNIINIFSTAENKSVSRTNNTKRQKYYSNEVHEGYIQQTINSTSAETYNLNATTSVYNISVCYDN